ncbi:Molybdopterin synthase catalytic subunit [Beauveria bassiana]|uniref:Molybdopterin synthase catalytic subunit n=1 Tax=Beauveria bassiana (strain ARSEF 2860) TaxID=655819 RepID=J5JMI2_BEAB2|nr:molybdopterin synthase large subunit [Beauveria bassiana ARSEF 2860]EJP64266.1 molybdopterin synthase large subunit [Beauveria bassiana ARSEF 2860]KAF1735759.1 Molybdopterin synthase catalytic subunit [Beauveria bassiana]KAH8711317.1 Molybdopterin synthase catalytic subunit [Beauveria bassiana]
MTTPDDDEDPWHLTSPGCHVALTHSPLDIPSTMALVRSPSAGAIVLFAGTTRDNFAGKPVKELQYTSYRPRALRTMLGIATALHAEHGLVGLALVHRLGVVPVGEESILIAASSPHRQAAWRAGEAALEACKEKVEVWKREEFEGEEEGVWRANRDGAVGEKVAE